MTLSKNLKIVITGGPGGGKTTALDLFKREYTGRACIVPEAATVLFSSNIQRPHNPSEVMSLQKAIFELQHTLEELVEHQNPNKLIICDRGSLDGLAYWPSSENNFFENMQSNLESELSRYDAVIFFETAAASGKDIHSNNPYRKEDSNEAVELDEKLQEVWKRHKNFHLIKSDTSFLKKITNGINKIDEVLEKFN